MSTPGHSGKGSSAAPSYRVWALQVAVLVGIGLLLAMIGNTTLENLDRLGVQSGFEFLTKRAGFDINQALFEYSSNSPVYIAFLVALCNTLLLAVLSITLATAIGLAVALCRVSRDWFFNALGIGFIEIFRNIPALLQIFFWYFVVLRALPQSDESWRIGDSMLLNNRGLFLPNLFWSIGGLAIAVAVVLTVLLIGRIAYGLRNSGKKLRPMLGSWRSRLITAGWILAAVAWFIAATQWEPPARHHFGYASDLVISPELLALILGIAIYNASSVAEVIRAGFMAVPKGQWEAARSLGLPPLQVLRTVIVPQAMRVIIPPMTTVYLNIFKATSLGAAIGYPEIVSVMVGTTNNIVGRPVEIMFLTFAVYSVVSLLGIALMARINRRHNQFVAM